MVNVCVYVVQQLRVYMVSFELKKFHGVMPLQNNLIFKMN